MPTTKLTRRGLAGITPAEKRVVYYDEDLAGFAMRVEPTGRMTYFVEYRPGAGGRVVVKKRLTLGTTAELKPEEARERAKTLLAQVRLGSDPATAKAKAKRVPTFAKYAAEHLDAMDEIAQKHPEQATLRPGSIRCDRLRAHARLTRALRHRLTAHGTEGRWEIVSRMAGQAGMHAHRRIEVRIGLSHDGGGRAPPADSPAT